MNITLSDVLRKEFKCVKIETGELKKIIKEFLEDMRPGDKIKEYKIEDDGVRIIMESGEEIDIEIDWNELIIK